MKKIVMGLSLMMALIAAPATFAASQQQNESKECTEQSCPGKGKKECKKESSECCKKECKDKKECERKKECRDNKKECKGKKECKKSCDGQFAKRGEGRGKKMDKEARRAAMFEGITLSDAQQQKLQTLDNKVKAEKAEAKAKMQEEKQKMKEKADKGREKFRAEYDKALRDILTPEQYAKYQENQQAAQAKRAEKKAAKEARKAEKMKARKDGKKGDRMRDGQAVPQENA